MCISVDMYALNYTGLFNVPVVLLPVYLIFKAQILIEFFNS